MNDLLNNIIKESRDYAKYGKNADYIPELAKADGNALGASITTVSGEEFEAGDCSARFTIQSISKVITLMMALNELGRENVFSKVGMNPSSDAFNSIIPLEYKNPDKPLNPMINAGAIAVVSMLDGEPEAVIQRILQFTRHITGNPDIDINFKAYTSEKETGNKNRSLAYYLKNLGIIKQDVEDVLDVYFRQCAMEISCRDIARIGAMLAKDGVMPLTGERVITKDIARIVKTIMVTCGLYDGSGEFAVNIGVPGKSGVGGGIMAAVPNRMGIGVFGPALDDKGNSLAGLKVLEALSRELSLSIF